MAHSPKYRSL